MCVCLPQAFAHLNAAAHYAIVERPAVGIVSGLVVSSLLLGLPQRMVKRMVFNMWGETAVLQRIEGRIVDMKGARAGGGWNPHNIHINV